MEAVNRIALLTKREQDRQLDLQKKKELREENDAVNERVGSFLELYEKHKKRIEEAIGKCVVVPAGELPEHFNQIYKDIQALQKYVAASNVFLRVYDIQRSNEAISELTSRTRQLEEKLLPKKKFGFKNKKIIKNDKNIITNGIPKDEVDFSKKDTKIHFEDNICGFSDRFGETLSMSPEHISKKDLSARNLTKCLIRFLGNASTLHCSNLKDCILLCGPVSTSIFAENCESCTFVVACQQLRLHTSKNIKIYLHVTSHGILEDCTGIQVAPYNLRYKNIKEDFEKAGLNMNTNNWDDLNDFNWLNADKKSPNWSIMDDNERVASWDNLIAEC